MSDPQPGPEPQPAPASVPPGNPTRAGQQPMVEEVYYDGPCSWWARSGSLAWAGLLTIVLISAAILVAARVSDWRPWPTVALVLASLIAPALLYFRHTSTRYKVTNYRVDWERGIMGTQIDSLELWHVDDISFRQPVIYRMVGIGTIQLRSDDKMNPLFVLPGIPGGRQLFETLKSRIIAAKRERGLLELDQ